MYIGQKIRDERKMIKMTLEELAKKVGISKMTLHRIETNKTSPSIAVLGDIAQTLRKPITSFIEEERSFIKITRKKDQFSLENAKLKMRNILPRGAISPNILGTMAVNYGEAKDGTEIETHTNKGFEWVFQLKGKTILNYDNKEYVAHPGDVFYYDGRRPHSVKYFGKNSFMLISFS